MTLVRLDFNSLEKASNEFNECNDIITDNMKMIYDELTNIHTVLDTPKSSKIIPEQIKYMEEVSQYINDKHNYFSNLFVLIKNTYANVDQNVKGSVGDTSEKK